MKLNFRWNDVIFALLFFAQLGAFIGIAVISLRGIGASAASNSFGSSGGNSITLNLFVFPRFFIVGRAIVGREIVRK